MLKQTLVELADGREEVMAQKGHGPPPPPKAPTTQPQGEEAKKTTSILLKHFMRCTPGFT
ncbi:MAG: hypothetical protein FWC28_00440 [Proteobacteria bacterium]|nr:hypothetical protein [Pseudomonadota bacterium]